VSNLDADPEELNKEAFFFSGKGIDFNLSVTCVAGIR
jgi:hypothetical protein